MARRLRRALPGLQDRKMVPLASLLSFSQSGAVRSRRQGARRSACVPVCLRAKGSRWLRGSGCRSPSYSETPLPPPLPRLRAPSYCPGPELRPRPLPESRADSRPRARAPARLACSSLSRSETALSGTGRPPLLLMETSVTSRGGPRSQIPRNPLNPRKNGPPEGSLALGHPPHTHTQKQVHPCTRPQRERGA